MYFLLLFGRTDSQGLTKKDLVELIERDLKKWPQESQNWSRTKKPVLVSALLTRGFTTNAPAGGSVMQRDLPTGTGANPAQVNTPGALPNANAPGELPERSEELNHLQSLKFHEMQHQTLSMWISPLRQMLVVLNFLYTILEDWEALSRCPRSSSCRPSKQIIWCPVNGLSVLRNLCENSSTQFLQ